MFEDHGYSVRYTENGTRAHIVAATPTGNATTVCGIEATLGKAAEEFYRAHTLPMCHHCMREGELWHRSLRRRIFRTQ
jgi:hypothetical protein